MSGLPASSQTVVAYLGYLLESGSISAKSLQSYLSVINVVHNDFEYPLPACGHLVRLAHKGSGELRGSSMLQPQQVTAFPAEHMFIIVMFGLRPNASKHQIRVRQLKSPSSVVLIQVSSGLPSVLKSPTLRSASIRQPRISHAIKQNPLRECPQNKTIPTTASTSFRSAGKRYATIETQTSTGISTSRRFLSKSFSSFSFFT
jgi:hypothetical protein